MDDGTACDLDDDDAQKDGGSAEHGETPPSRTTRWRPGKRAVLATTGIIVGMVVLTFATLFTVDQLNRVAVPDTEEKTLAEVKATVASVGLKLEIVTEWSFCEDDDRAPVMCVVTAQTPSAGERVHAGELVSIEVVPADVTAPSLEGMTFEQAVAAGDEVAIEVRLADHSDIRVEGHEKWKVVGQSKHGTLLAGESVNVTLERPLVDAPNVKGMPLQAAMDALIASGFEPELLSKPAIGAQVTYDPSWVVTDTDPAASEGKLPIASRVSLSWGVQMPNVVGAPDLAAKSTLSNAKLQVTGSHSSSQRVSAQEPAAGTIVAPGATVTITLEPPSTVYEVVSNGSRATITWVEPNSFNISQAVDQPVPWRMSWPTASGYRNFNAQIMSGNSVTCNIYVNGQLVKTATSTGQYAVVSCG